VRFDPMETAAKDARPTARSTAMGLLAQFGSEPEPPTLHGLAIHLESLCTGGIKISVRGSERGGRLVGQTTAQRLIRSQPAQIWGRTFTGSGKGGNQAQSINDSLFFVRPSAGFAGAGNTG